MKCSIAFPGREVKVETSVKKRLVSALETRMCCCFKLLLSIRKCAATPSLILVEIRVKIILFQRLNLTYDELLSSFQAVKLNMRCYATEVEASHNWPLRRLRQEYLVGRCS